MANEKIVTKTPGSGTAANRLFKTEAKDRPEARNTGDHYKPYEVKVKPTPGPVQRGRPS